LEEAPLFKVLGKKKEEGDGGGGKIYLFTEAEKDGWANLFEYMGSEENVRLKFAVDKIGVSLNETSIIFGDSLNADAWDQFISSLKNGRKEESGPVEESVEERKISWPFDYRWGRGAVRYPLPDKPSIAVLSFSNMTGDPREDYLGDGIAEEIITALSKSPKLFVIDRNSTFVYKGKPVSIKQVAEELGVQYVLEGSFRKTGDKVRITAQLIDALSGHHLWAERYDGELKDIFALQDEITVKITSALNLKLTDGEIARMFGKSTKNLEAYLKLIQARELMLQMNKENNVLSRKLVEEAIALDSGYAMAYGLMASIYINDVLLGTSQSPEESTARGIEMAQKSIALDKNLAWPHGALTFFYAFKKDYDKALSEGETALALEPNSALSYMWLGHGLLLSGRWDEAIAAYEKAIRLSPFPPSAILVNLGVCLRSTGRYEEAVAVFKKSLQKWPDLFFGHLHLAATYSMMGREKEARAEATEALRIDPKFSLDYYAKILPYNDQPQKDKVINVLRNVLREARPK
jgi:adenylate cyclase